MNRTPIQIDSQASPGRELRRIEIQSNESKNESWLQECLFHHPELLPVEEFGDWFAPPIPIGREVKTDGSDSIDILYISPEGALTIVETKLWKNPEKHRTVVAQIIDYAKSVARWSYDDLALKVKAASRRSERKQATTLEEMVGPILLRDNIRLDEFQENVAENLAQGNFLLLIVGDQVSPKAAQLGEAVHGSPGLAFTLGFVEMQLYVTEKGQDWPLLVVPDVVGRTVPQPRYTINIRYSGEKPDAKINETSDEPKPTSQSLDREVFLRQVRPDLAVIFKDAMGRWIDFGGDLHFTGKMFFCQIEINGKSHGVIRGSVKSIGIVTSKAFDRWCKPSLNNTCQQYQQYLKDLQRSKTALNAARNEKVFVSLEKLTPEDVRVILEAGISLGESLKTSMPSSAG